MNVAAGRGTPKVVAEIRERFPHMPIIATGGKTDESIRETISAGADAISWTPPSIKDIEHDMMDEYRSEIDMPDAQWEIPEAAE